MPIRVVAAPSPYDLRGTLRGLAVGPGDPTARIGDREAWLTAHPETGPVTLHLIHDTTSNDVIAEAFGPGAVQQLDQLESLLGFRDRPEDFVAHHDVVRAGQRKSLGQHLPRTGWMYEALTSTVFGQRITVIEANQIYRRFVSTYGEPAPHDPALRVFPRPDVVAGLGYADFHPLGLERRRAETILFLAARARRIADRVAGPREELDRFLHALPGISHWTIGSVCAAVLGDPDAVAVGDYHIPNHVCWNLAGEPRGTDERMLELLEPYRGQRGRAISYLLRGGESAPKYGPRTAARDISRF